MQAESSPKKQVGEEKVYCNQKPLKSEPNSVQLEPTHKQYHTVCLLQPLNSAPATVLFILNASRFLKEFKERDGGKFRGCD